MFSCTKCEKKFTIKHNLQRHIKYTCNKNSLVLCKFCGKTNTLRAHKKHMDSFHKDQIDFTTSASSSSGLDKNTNNEQFKIKRKKSEHESDDNILCTFCNLQVKKLQYNAHLKTNLHKMNASKQVQDSDLELSIIST